MLIDCHCHLSFPEFSQDLKLILEQIKGDFYAVIESTVNLENTQKALSLFSDYEFVYFSLGFHPYYAGEFKREILDKYIDVIEENKRVVSIGEVGLDIKSKASLEEQKRVFLEFLDLAVQFDLPVIIHNRGFKESIIDLLRKKRVKNVVLHCFSQDVEFLDLAVKNRYFISFAGNLTFKNSYSLKECAKKAPLEFILSETDSPFLAPQKIRGKRNTPLYVREVIEEISRQKEKERAEIEEVVLKNAKEVFNI